MSQPFHWTVFDRETGEPKYGYEPPVQEPDADSPVSYSLTPAAEALLGAEAGGMTAPWEWQGRTADTAEINLTEEDGRQSGAEARGGRGPSASYAEWLAEGQPEAMSAGNAWDAYVTAQQAADEAVRECGGSPGDGTPEGGRAVFLLDSADLAWSQFEATGLAEPETGA
jgi:hypothetical protein